MCYLSNKFNGVLLNWIDPVMDRAYRLHKLPLFEEWLGKAKSTDPTTQTILEIGAGTGANLRYYPSNAKVIALEPCESMHSALLSRAQREDVAVDIVNSVAESIPLEDESVRTVIATLVFCTIPEPEKALAEVHRVLKPGGRMLFVEHVAAQPGSALRLYQKSTSLIWAAMFGGCRLQRDTQSLFESSLFSQRQIESFQFRPRILPFVPHICGWLEK